MKKLGHHTFGGIIWKLLFDEPAAVLAVETRAPGSARAVFTTINLVTGDVLLRDYSPDENWPCGLEAARNGVLLIHGYESEGSPAHLGLLALNAQTGDVLWQNFAWAADATYDDSLTVFNRKVLPWKKQQADWKSGRVTGEAKTGRENSTLKTPVKTAVWPLHLPEPEGERAGYIDYLRQDDVEILSLHTQKTPGFDQHLFVFRNSRLVYSDLLAGGIQKMLPEAFVLQQNRLVYIRNKNELVLLDISAGK